MIDHRTTVLVQLNLRTALLAMGAVAAAWAIVKLLPVVLVIVVALMVVGMLGPIVERLERHKMKRGVAIAVVFFGLFAAVVAFVALTVPRFVTEASEMSTRMPQLQAHLADQLSRSKWGAPLADQLRRNQSTEWITRLEKLGFAYSSRIVEIVAYTVTSLFLALYVIIDRDRMRGALFALIPRAHHVQASRILLNLEEIVGGYMRGQVITSALMAAFTFVVLLIAGVSNALVWAAIAGVADVLPYVGAFFACGPAFLAALPRGTVVAFAVLAALAVYQELESRFIVPRIYGKVLRLPAATVMVSLLVGGELLGILGALLALPIAAGIRMIVEELRVDFPGEDVPPSEVRRQDMQEAAEQREFAARAAGAPATEAAAIAIEIAEARREPAAPDRAASKL